MAPAEIRPSMRESLAWNYGAHILVFAVTLGSAIIVSRLLTPRELGVFGVGIAISGILGTLSFFGVANYLIRDSELSAQTVATCFTVNAIMSVLAGGLLWQLGTVGHSLFSDPGIPRVLRLLALVPVIGIFEFLPAALLTREMRFGPISLLQLGKSASNAAAVIAFAYAGWSYLSPVFGALMGAAFGAVCFSVVGWRHVSFRLSFKGGAAVVVFATQLISAGGIPLIASRSAELIVAHVLGLSALGLYTRASGFAGMIWEGAYGLSTRIIYVRMAAELRDTGSLKGIFLDATKLLTAVIWPMMAGVAVLSGPIVHLLYGPEWQGAALPLALLMVGQFIAIGFAMNWELCVLAHRTAWQARVEAVRAMIGLAVFAAAVPFGLSAAAVGRGIDALLGFVIYRPKMAEMAQATTTELREAYSGSLLLAAIAVGPAICLMSFFHWAYSVPVEQVAFAIATGGLLWAFALYMTRHPLFDELISFAGPRRSGAGD